MMIKTDGPMFVCSVSPFSRVMPTTPVNRYIRKMLVLASEDNNTDRARNSVPVISPILPFEKRDRATKTKIYGHASDDMAGKLTLINSPARYTRANLKGCSLLSYRSVLP